jgi:hypothetical protein
VFNDAPRDYRPLVAQLSINLHETNDVLARANAVGDRRVLKMVHNTKNYWRFGHCPSSGILKTLKNTTFRKPDLLLFSGEGEGKTPNVI